MAPLNPDTRHQAGRLEVEELAVEVETSTGSVIVHENREQPGLLSELSLQPHSIINVSGCTQALGSQSGEESSSGMHHSLHVEPVAHLGWQEACSSASGSQLQVPLGHEFAEPVHNGPLDSSRPAAASTTSPSTSLHQSPSRPSSNPHRSDKDKQPSRQGSGLSQGLPKSKTTQATRSVLDMVWDCSSILLSASAIVADAVLLKSLIKGWCPSSAMIAASLFLMLHWVVMALLVLVRNNWLQHCEVFYERLVISHIPAFFQMPDNPCLKYVHLVAVVIMMLPLVLFGFMITFVGMFGFMLVSILSLPVLDAAAVIATLSSNRTRFRSADLVYLENYKFARLTLQGLLESLPMCGLIIYLLAVKDQGCEAPVHTAIELAALAVAAANVLDKALLFACKLVRMSGRKISPACILMHLGDTFALRGAYRVPETVIQQSLQTMLSPDGQQLVIDDGDMKVERVAPTTPRQAAAGSSAEPSTGGAVAPVLSSAGATNDSSAHGSSTAGLGSRGSSANGSSQGSSSDVGSSVSPDGSLTSANGTHTDPVTPDNPPADTAADQQGSLGSHTGLSIGFTAEDPGATSSFPSSSTASGTASSAASSSQLPKLLQLLPLRSFTSWRAGVSPQTQGTVALLPQYLMPADARALVPGQIVTVVKEAMSHCSADDIHSLTLAYRSNLRTAAILKEALGKFTQLRQLVLCDIKVVGADFTALTSDFCQHPSLEVLCFQDCVWDLRGWTMMCEVVAQSRSLRQLQLPRCGFTFRGVTRLAKALKANCGNLTSLDLSGNHLGKQGAQALAELISSGCALQELNLASTNIGTSGLSLLTAAILAAATAFVASPSTVSRTTPAVSCATPAMAGAAAASPSFLPAAATTTAISLAAQASSATTHRTSASLGVTLATAVPNGLQTGSHLPSIACNRPHTVIDMPAGMLELQSPLSEVTAKTSQAAAEITALASSKFCLRQLVLSQADIGVPGLLAVTECLQALTDLLNGTQQLHVQQDAAALPVENGSVSVGCYGSFWGSPLAAGSRRNSTSSKTVNPPTAVGRTVSVVEAASASLLTTKPGMASTAMAASNQSGVQLPGNVLPPTQHTRHRRVFSDGRADAASSTAIQRTRLSCHLDGAVACSALGLHDPNVLPTRNNLVDVSRVPAAQLFPEGISTGLNTCRNGDVPWPRNILTGCDHDLGLQCQGADSGPSQTCTASRTGRPSTSVTTPGTHVCAGGATLRNQNSNCCLSMRQAQRLPAPTGFRSTARRNSLVTRRSATSATIATTMLSVSNLPLHLVQSASDSVPKGPSLLQPPTLVSDFAVPQVYIMCKDDFHETVSNAPAFLPRITELDLSGLPIGDKGVSIVASALYHAPCLHTLDLSATEMSDTGLQTLASALQVNPQVADIRLNSNPITDVGGLVIAHLVSSYYTNSSRTPSGSVHGHSMPPCKNGHGRTISASSSTPVLRAAHLSRPLHRSISLANTVFPFSPSVLRELQLAVHTLNAAGAVGAGALNFGAPCSTSHPLQQSSFTPHITLHLVDEHSNCSSGNQHHVAPASASPTPAVHSATVGAPTPASATLPRHGTAAPPSSTATAPAPAAATLLEYTSLAGSIAADVMYATPATATSPSAATATTDVPPSPAAADPGRAQPHKHTLSILSECSDPDTTCAVCFDAPNTVYIKPCDHKMCSTCYTQLLSQHKAKPAAQAAQGSAKCPFCRAAIEGYAYRKVHMV